MIKILTDAICCFAVGFGFSVTFASYYFLLNGDSGDHGSLISNILICVPLTLLGILLMLISHDINKKDKN